MKASHIGIVIGFIVLIAILFVVFKGIKLNTNINLGNTSMNPGTKEKNRWVGALGSGVSSFIENLLAQK